MRSRHLLRIAVMQTLFAYEFQEGGSKRSAKDILSDVLQELKKESKEQGKRTFAFAYELLNGILAHSDEIRRVIETKAPEWPFSKISPVDRAVLQIGVFEILYSKEVPPVVAINEAIEIAKQYGGENSSKFVNGVLSNVMKDTHHEPLSRT